MLAITLALAIICTATKTMAVNAASDSDNITGIVGQFTLDDDAMAVVIYNINRETGIEIDEAIVAIEQVNKTEGSVTETTPRNWADYGSSVADDNLSSSELAYYNRLRELCDYYMNNSTIDGYWVKAYNLYAINGVQYDDLGLTSVQAFYVAQWFLYNNPQYYFLRPTFLTTSKAIYMSCYDVAVDGDDRAELTNDMFDTIDYYVTEIQDDIDAYLMEHPTASRQWITTKYLHDIVCGYTIYESNDYDQSIYSTISLGKTVCAGYTGYMNALCSRAGLDVCTGLSSSHAWNEVNIDGEWYAVDCTWDDSLNCYLFFAVNDDDLKKYDSKGEHMIETSWIDWTPQLSNTSYGSTNSSIAEINLSTPATKAFAVEGSSSSFRISWDQVPDASFYEVNIYTDESMSNPLVSTTTKSLQVRIDGAKEGMTYYYAIRACRDYNSTRYYSEYAYGNYYIDNSPTDSQLFEAKLDTPANFGVDKVTTSSIRFRWDPVENAQTYTIDLYLDETMSKIAASKTIAKTTLTVTNLSENQTVYAKVRANATVDDVEYYSDYVESSGTTDVTPETHDENKPSDLKVSNITAFSCDITWTVGEGLCHVMVISNDDDMNVVLDTTVADSSIHVTGLNPSTEYVAGVFGTYAGESIENYADEEIVDTIFKTLSLEDVDEWTVVAPDVTVTNITETSATVNWKSLSDGVNKAYVVKLYDANSNLINQYDNIKDNSLQITNLEDDCDYFVSVIETSKSPNSKRVLSSSEDNKCSFRTLEAIPTVTSPTNLDATSITENSCKLIWDAVADIDKYELQISKLSDFSRLLVDTTSNKTRVNISGFAENTTYYARVRSLLTYKNKTYCSEWIDATFTTESSTNIIVDTPIITIGNVDINSAEISWTKGNASTYNVTVKESETGATVKNVVTSKTSLSLSDLKADTKYTVELSLIHI